MSAERALSAADRPSPGAVGAWMGELFVAHGRMVYGLCRLLLRDPVEAEDAAQQTFLSAHASLLGGAVPRKPAAWLATIARNECTGRIHARMREPLPLDEDRDAGEWPEETITRSAQVEALSEALRELPERQRQAFVLRELYGLRYREVCSALGLSLPAVQSLLLRARRQLQTRLRPLQLAPALTVPPGLRDALSEAIPSFLAGSGGAGAGTGVAAVLLAKAAAAPAGAKVAAATVAASAVGAAGMADMTGDAAKRGGLPTRVQPVPAQRDEPRERPVPARAGITFGPVSAATRADDVDVETREQREDERGEGRGGDDEHDDETGQEHGRDAGDDGADRDAEEHSGHEAEPDDAQADHSGPGGGERRAEELPDEEVDRSGPPPAPEEEPELELDVEDEPEGVED